MATAKQVINNLLDAIPESQLPEVVDFVAFIKKRNENPMARDLTEKNLTEKNLEEASLSSMDFWDNAIDDEVWNDV